MFRHLGLTLGLLLVAPGGLWAQAPARVPPARVPLGAPLPGAVASEYQPPTPFDQAAIYPTEFASTQVIPRNYPVYPVNLTGGQVPSINAQKIGHKTARPQTQDAINSLHDKLDRCPCCGYGKTHNDMGVPGLYADKVNYFGSACEFFSEPNRVPPKGDGCLTRLWKKMTGSCGEASCASCGSATR